MNSPGSRLSMNLSIAIAFSFCMTVSSFAANPEVMADLCHGGIAEATLMTYCPSISYVGADSVHAVYDQVSKKLFLVGVVYPENSKEGAFVIAGVDARMNDIGEGADLKCKGSNVKLHRDGIGETLWVDETFEWTGEKLQRTEFHRTVDAGQK